MNRVRKNAGREPRDALGADEPGLRHFIGRFWKVVREEAWIVEVTSRPQLISNDQWTLLADVLPGPTRMRGRPFADARLQAETIIHRNRCGIAWRDLPEVFGPWQTVWQRHTRMADNGTRDLVKRRLHEYANRARVIDWDEPVYSTTARARTRLLSKHDPSSGGASRPDMTHLRSRIGPESFSLACSHSRAS